MSFLWRGRAKNQVTTEKTSGDTQVDPSVNRGEQAPAALAPVVLAPTLREWLAQPTLAASRAWLQAHVSELPTQSVADLKAAAVAESDPRQRERLNLHAQLLMLARREGVDRAYERVPFPPDMSPETEASSPSATGSLSHSAPTAPPAPVTPETVTPDTVPSPPAAPEPVTAQPAPPDVAASAPAMPSRLHSESWHDQLVPPPAHTPDVSHLTGGAPPDATEALPAAEAAATPDTAEGAEGAAPTDVAPAATGAALDAPPDTASSSTAAATGPADASAGTDDLDRGAADRMLLGLAAALDEPEHMQALIRAHAARIVTLGALERARVLVAEATARGDAEAAQRLEIVARIVEHFQGMDPAAVATAEVTAQENPRAIADLLIAWIGTPDWSASRQFLSEHEELLKPGVEGILAMLADQQEEEGARQAVTQHLRLLALCRDLGIEEGYRRFLTELRASSGSPMELPGGEVPPEARLAAQNALSNPRLRTLLPEDVIQALEELLSPSPTARQVENGLRALAAVDMWLERTYLQGILTRLLPALWDWWSTSSWPASRTWLDAHLGDLPANAPALLRQAGEEVRQRGMTSLAASCDQHADILEMAWREGVDAAFRRYVGADAFAEARDEDLRQVMSQITEWINTPDWDASRAYLLAHDHLLSTRAEGVLQLLAEAQGPTTRHIVEEHERLLALCRAFGIEDGYRRFLSDLRAARHEQAEAAAAAEAAGAGGQGGGGPVSVPPHVRQLVERVLAHPEGLPGPVLDALRALAAPNPSREEITRGLAALAAVAAAASQRHAISVLTKRSPDLAQWYETPTWAASRLWLTAHQGDLPTDALAQLRAAAAEARDDGDEVSAEAIERHAVLLERAQAVGVDAAYREVIGDDAFADDSRATEAVAPAEVRIGQQVEAWIRSRDWAASREYLRAHPDLLSDAGAHALDLLDRAQRTDENHRIVRDHILLLSEAREQGVDAAYDAFLAELARTHRPRGRPLNAEVEHHLIEWLETPNWDSSRAYLTGHQQELLSDVGEANLASLYDVQTTDNRRRSVAAHQRLLALCRRYGITDGYFRFFADEPAQPTKAGTATAPTEVSPQARALAERMLAELPGLPPDVIEALRALVAPAPTPEQIARGLAAVTAVAVALSTQHAQSLLASRSPLLAEWYVTRSWVASREWLRDHLDQLPPDAEDLLLAAAAEARDDGDEESAESITRHAEILAQARRDGVDPAFRALVGEDAFAQSSDEDTTRDRLVRISQEVQEWIRTPNWDASRAYLRAHPDILGDAGAAVLHMLVEAQDNDGARQMVADHQRLLAAAREQGIDAAYDAFLRDRPQPTDEERAAFAAAQQLAQTLIEWMKTPSWDESATFLASHPELLTDAAEHVLAQLRDIQEQDGARREIIRHLRLLSYCRALGVMGGYQRFIDEEQGLQTT